MTTVDKIPIDAYLQYARRSNDLAAIDGQYHLRDAASIPAQIRVLDFYPKPTEMDTLFGVARVENPWAYFFPPPKFQFQRRSPFGFFRVAPSLGSFQEEEETEQELDEIECTTEEEKTEKKAIKNCFEQIKKINNWLSFIVGRVGQFLQG